MFLHLFVSHSVHGGSLSGRPPGQRPPCLRQTPPRQRPLGQRPTVQRPHGQTPLDRDPQTETPWTKTPGQRPPLNRGPLGQRPPPYGNEWVVCILLECILVYNFMQLSEKKSQPMGNLTSATGNHVGQWYHCFQWRILHSKILDAPPPRGPNSFNFIQFLGKLVKIACWRPPPEGWRPHLGEILDPPLVSICTMTVSSKYLKELKK